MGTKNKPGVYDCYAKAEPDEPMFVLLGRDRHAALLVRLWALLRHRESDDRGDAAKIEEALECAKAMDVWQVERRGRTIYPRPKVVEDILIAATAGMDDHPDGYDDACDCDECRSYA